MVSTKFFNASVSRLCKSEAGKSQIKVGDMRQCLSILMKQHYTSRKGDPSILLGLARKAGSKHMKRAKKK